ncbi:MULTISPECIES: SAM-dependent methyltransferase [Actinomadura]|uniref:SAM-dependent methyltransferase n=1 Tax=Actinomadura litoris TaxID=2678616 RepID=A0A7K1KXA0_9ACTN|nr:MULTISPECIES: SAM-dependent methyltransferase [Actinomadura]MBT2210930.1 SAM-dependent methyltransferase [Actinomadura sp. NEAU-AAG7]MUN36824.1 SAM-dependent methyltransferase [Actinomadura litoris]
MSNEEFFAAAERELMAEIDTSVPHSARIWNYWLGGSDNFAVDQEAGEEYARTFPAITVLARLSREFLGRAVRYLAAERGVRQFLDIGTGLPTEENTHQVAQRAAPESRIVYVDNDPLVLVHARALLTSRPEGATHYIDADLHDPAGIIERARAYLDFDEPIALMLMGILGHVADDGEALSIARRLLAALPSGSYLVLYDGTATDQAFIEAQQGYDDTGAVPYRLRHPDTVAAFFAGLDLVEPGVVPLPLWRPDPSPLDPPGSADAYCGVARKP